MAYDLAIIGSGFAGLVVAMLAYERGLNFCLIAKDFGASQHFSGAFDFVDPRFLNPCMGVGDVPMPELAYAAFVRAHPHHIYAQMGLTAADILPCMRKFFSFYQIPVIGDGSRFVFAISSFGRIKPTCFTLNKFALTESDFLKSAVVVGFPFLTDYPAGLIARNLQKEFSSVSVVNFTGFSLNRTSPSVSLQKTLDSEENRHKLLHFLRVHHNSLIILPPVLMTTKDLLDLSYVQMLSCLPSMAGELVMTCVAKTFMEKKIKYLRAKVCGHEVKAGRVEKIFLSEGGETIVAKEYILATGKYVGGGIAADPEFTETVFALPLQTMGSTISRQTSMEVLITDFPREHQPFMQVGVDPRSPFKNLSVCGQVLSGFDFTRERNGFGVSVATAMRAIYQGNIRKPSSFVA